MLDTVSSRGDLSRGESLRVFVSYSRDDLDFADQLSSALGLYGFACSLDRHSVSAGEDWKRRLGSLIAEADTIVFVLSPSSARSDICAWEVQEAQRLGKRILPVVCRPLEGEQPPQALASLDYIFFHPERRTPGGGFGTGLVRLVTALNTDLDWLRAHTRYLQRATEWDFGGRPANRLLTGRDIEDAKAWVSRRPKSAPEPTSLHLDYFKASEAEAVTQQDVRRQQLSAIASAQAEREKALQRAEEALAQAEEARRRRARVRNLALAAVSIAAVVAAGLGLWANSERLTANQQRADAEAARQIANQQRAAAEAARQTAIKIVDDATSIIVSSEKSFDDATNQKAFSVFKRAADELDIGNAIHNAALSLSWGRGVDKNQQLACDYYEKGAGRGVAQSMNNLASCFETGRGRLKSDDKALYWYTQAAEKGYLRASLRLAEKKVFAGAPLDTEVVEQTIKKAANSKDTDDLQKVAAVYEAGKLVPRNLDEAMRLYKQAAAAGRADCMYAVGRLYSDAVQPDKKEGVKWYLAAAKLGDASAMNSLGYAFETGIGADRSAEQALDWYTKSANAGNNVAMDNLGLVFRFGKIGDKNVTLARQWFEKAVAEELQSAMLHLADLEIEEKNEVQARVLLSKAADLGNEDAKTRLERMQIDELKRAGDFVGASKLQSVKTVRIESAETKQDGAPGKLTASSLTDLSWYLLNAGMSTQALEAAERANSLRPGNLVTETNRAHALMFVGRIEEARAIYSAHKGKKIADDGSDLWEKVIGDDFTALRKSGNVHPMMIEVERHLGIEH